MNIAIIGAGNMGGAIARGLLQAKKVEPANLLIADPNVATLESLKALGIQTFEHGVDAARNADLVIVAVKPWLAKEVMHKIASALRPTTMIVSIAAGVTLEQMEEELSGRPVFRVIPNTAVLAEQSMTFISSDNASNEQEQIIVSLFTSLGKAILIPEQQMAAATALSSCGIAYAMRYISANMRAGIEIGFSPDMAKEIILQTIQGAVSLLSQTGGHPETEIDKVTTPKGLTIKGINALDHAGFTSAIIHAVKAAM